MQQIKRQNQTPVTSVQNVSCLLPLYLTDHLFINPVRGTHFTMIRLKHGRPWPGAQRAPAVSCLGSSHSCSQVVSWKVMNAECYISVNSVGCMLSCLPPLHSCKKTP